MRILFIGDIVGPPGVTFLQAGAAAADRPRAASICVIANAENAANGSGLTPSLYRKIREAGVDLVTLGDHIYKKAEIIPTLAERGAHLQAGQLPARRPRPRLRPGAGRRTARRWPSFCLLGRTFMRSVDCPFRAADRVLAALPADVRVHRRGHATPRRRPTSTCWAIISRAASAPCSARTPTCQTADEQILPGGTAFISDVGMTGPYDSILGRRIDRVLSTTVTFVPSAFDVAEGDPRLAGAVVEVDAATGKAASIRRVMLDEKGLDALLPPTETRP